MAANHTFKKPGAHFLCYLAMAVTIAFGWNTPAKAQTSSVKRPWIKREEGTVRFASFNIAMNRRNEGQLKRELESGKSRHATKIAKVIQSVRPNVLFICEIDRDEKEETLKHFREKYLQKDHGDLKGIDFSYSFFAESNTGVRSGVDLDGDGKTGGLGDCFGFGQFPGKYAMAVLSKYPIDKKRIRTFQKMLWKDMPGAKLPMKADGKTSFYPSSSLEHFRLSSKSHWALPIKTPVGEIYFVTAHPTPPVFDGPEDRNGLRNHDEIRLAADIVNPKTGSYLIDDQGRKGALPEGSHFVIAGDMNADPVDGDSADGATSQLTKHPLIHRSPTPQSVGAVEATEIQKGVNKTHKGNPKFDTGDFNDRRTGNMRIDYVLPSKTLKVTGCGVFWPTKDMEEAAWAESSDHRLVWVDVAQKEK